ncbi:hypothetical protein PISMIDRAFT_10518 [Pisolithus microcarpus 441]|uniref:Uncharacterized protein n=1 Tax=Pisolithus microcarpus 441 TaxID=765257 RepID=A0A0C9ZDX0_9AGAM|nr:hypothetical protein PISMIDRAFT_10518 [Pisolithus microcarpus 441]
MSMTKTATSTKAVTQPRYLSPDASRKLIPKMWAANMERLRSLMREVPDEAAAEDVARGWMDKYYKVLDHIEGLRQYAADLSTEVPEYPEETQEAIRSTPGGAGGSQAGSETTRWSQQQLEKAAARGNEGDKDLPVSGGSAPIEAAATSPQESATQGSGGGTEAPTLGMQVETEACERMSHWEEEVRQSWEARQEAKESRCPPGVVGFDKQKGEDDVCPPSIVFSPPEGRFKAAGAVTSLPNLNLPPTAPSISQPPPPLFLPSSPTNTPIPSTSRTEVEPQDYPMTFAASLSGLLDEAPSGDPKTPRLSVQGEDDTSSCPHGSAEARWTPFSGTPHAVAQYDACLAAALSTVEWAESLMAKLHSGMGQLGLIIQQAKRDIHQLQEWWQDNFEDRQ